MVDPLAIHDVTVGDQTVFTPTGAAGIKTVVTFYVGVHGPFRLEYDKEAATAEAITHDMNSQVVKLRQLPGVGMAGA